MSNAEEKSSKASTDMLPLLRDLIRDLTYILYVALDILISKVYLTVFILQDFYGNYDSVDFG